MHVSIRSPWLPLIAASLWLWLAPAASAVDFEWVPVGDPGNACEQQSFGCYGAVDYIYRIATHEVTNAQYAEFLNAKAASDPLGLYNPNMATSGGITRSGSDGNYTYSAIPGREDMPVNRVSYFDTLRFVNWLHNGQGDGDTETGAYTLLGGTPTPSNPLVQRNSGAQIFLPSDEEWYKAAFYDTSAGYFLDFPTATGTGIVCNTPTATPDTANCGNAVGGFTAVGSYPGTPGPNGTFDQGGNASEWTDGDVGVLENRTIRGGRYHSPAEDLGADDVNNLDYDDPWYESAWVGFRVASLEAFDGGSECGNEICESPENALTCPGDCPDLCGDGVCSGDEDPLSCPGDCPNHCGDGLCSGAENVDNCWVDCGFCGDDICDPSENQTTCAVDCATVCGDGVVEGNEECETPVPLADTCESLGFDEGTLACNGSTCEYDTSDCTEAACLPRWARCSNDNECCSGDCRWWGRCR